VEDSKPEWIAQMTGVLEALNEGVLILDDCNRMLFGNERFLQMTGRTREQIEDRTPADFYSGKDLNYLMGEIARGEEQGRNRFPFHLLGPRDEHIPVVVSSRVIEDPDGRRFAVVTFTDISDQKRIEQELKEANAQLEHRQHEIQTELALASRVQQSLAPQATRWGRVVVETHYMPVHTIGGDFGLVTPLGDGHLNLLVCDVSGHGIGSALVANRIYTETMSLLERQAELGEMLRRLNHLVLQQIRMSGFYFSMAAVRLAEEGCRAEFASAGHPPAMWLSPSGELRRLESRSTVLGFFEDAVAPDPVEQIGLCAGDRLVLYTDGLTDVFDRRGEILGLQGLEEIVRKAARNPICEMKKSILEQVEAWRHEPVSDDISLIILERG